jgi:hypothetical protein
MYTGTPYPFYPIKNGIVEVEEVLCDGVNLSEGGHTLYEVDKLVGIPINTEWLGRCGFELFNRELLYVRKYHTQGELMLFSTDSPVGKSNGFPTGKFYYMFSGIAHFIDYVHQLQNLYFALTGEELTVKEQA